MYILVHFENLTINNQQKDIFNGHNKNNNEIKQSRKFITEAKVLKKVRQIQIKDITKSVRQLWNILEKDKNLQKDAPQTYAAVLPRNKKVQDTTRKDKKVSFLFLRQHY